MLVSYAQNFEDVMLWRALKHVKGGFYIDVGANDPVADSVTLVFYQRGWRGINIEPLRSHHDDLQRERPDDLNLQCAAGSFEGEVELVDFDVRGWATADASAAAEHWAHGQRGLTVKVPITTLANICRDHAPPDIHFLKIDVEGYEAAVLAGMDFRCHRPWIVVVEATRPNSAVQMHEQWEHFLIDADYQLVYCDGLNRFYVATEHQELKRAFEFPPNVFDDFIKAPQRLAEERVAHIQATAERADAAYRQALADLERSVQDINLRAQDAERRAQDAERRAQDADLRTEHARALAFDAEARASASAFLAEQAQLRMSALLNSTSWRVTAPMRYLGHAAYLIGEGIRGRTVPPTRWLGRQVRARPRLKKAILTLLKPFPSLSFRLRTASIGPAPMQATSTPRADRIDPLPPRVRRIQAALTAELATRHAQVEGSDAYRS